MQSKHVPILCCLDNKKKTTIILGPQPINPSTLLICQSILKKNIQLHMAYQCLDVFPKHSQRWWHFRAWIYGKIQTHI